MKSGITVPTNITFDRTTIIGVGTSILVETLYINQAPMILSTDNLANNGIIHQIEGVLMKSSSFLEEESTSIPTLTPIKNSPPTSSLPETAPTSSLTSSTTSTSPRIISNMIHFQAIAALTTLLSITYC